MDKEKAYKVFQELLEEYRECERVINHDRSTKTHEEDEAELAETCARYEKEMKKHLDIE
jgi:hypothetical protein